MIGIINRGNYTSSDAIQGEFENLTARLREIFLKEHNEDGTHITSATALNIVPVGAIVIWPTDTAKSGWVLCRGQQLSRLTYKGLFDVISTTYGAGDGSTTFNVPDLQQRFPLGKAVSGTGSTLAGTGGAIDHTHTTPAHGHTISGSTANESGHTHSVDPPDTDLTYDTTSFDTNLDGSFSPAVSDIGALMTPHTNIGSFTSGAGSAHGHGAGTLGADSGGSGTSGTANPPFLSLNYIIFTGVAS